MDRWVQRGRDEWRRARDFGCLCDLGARFLVGDVGYFPGWAVAETDEESDGIQQVLVDLNRAGFLTLASGRGDPDRAGEDGRTERRRAFVLGFASDPMLIRLRDLGDEVWIRDFGAREQGGEPLPVGLRANEVFLQVGEGAGELELEIFAADVGEQALRDLEQRRYVILVGLDWGQDGSFWSALADVARSKDRGQSA